MPDTPVGRRSPVPAHFFCAAAAVCPGRLYADTPEIVTENSFGFDAPFTASAIAFAPIVGLLRLSAGAQFTGS
jgi:hypothetical protein